MERTRKMREFCCGFTAVASLREVPKCWTASRKPRGETLSFLFSTDSDFLPRVKIEDMFNSWRKKNLAETVWYNFNPDLPDSWTCLIGMEIVQLAETTVSWISSWLSILFGKMRKALEEIRKDHVGCPFANYWLLQHQWWFLTGRLLKHCRAKLGGLVLGKAYFCSDTLDTSKFL